MSPFDRLVEKELAKARTKFEPINSGHEGYAVILEELQEFWDEVRLKSGTREGQLQELIQTAAMAQRTAEDLGLVERSGADRLRELLGEEEPPAAIATTPIEARDG